MFRASITAFFLTVFAALCAARQGDVVLRPYDLRGMQDAFNGHQTVDVTPPLLATIFPGESWLEKTSGVDLEPPWTPTPERVSELISQHLGFERLEAEGAMIRPAEGTLWIRASNATHDRIDAFLRSLERELPGTAEIAIHLLPLGYVIGRVTR